MVTVEGQHRPVPLKTLGGGAVRAFQIAMGIEAAAAPDEDEDPVSSSGAARSVPLLIDEIENGLHHTVLESIWEFIFAAAAQSGVQVFATTHSQECLEAFVGVAAKSELEGRVIRLDTRSGSARAVEMDEKNQAAVVKYGIEVR
ncbi:MAG: AAA family ATPase [Dehalococcoidia bacterium]